MPTIEFTREETSIVTYREDITEQQYANLVAGEVEDVQVFFDTLLEDNYDLDPYAEEPLDQGVWIQWRDVYPPFDVYNIPQDKD
jgi:hypothetical protein